MHFSSFHLVSLNFNLHFHFIKENVLESHYLFFFLLQSSITSTSPEMDQSHLSSYKRTFSSHDHQNKLSPCRSTFSQLVHHFLSFLPTKLRRRETILTACNQSCVQSYPNSIWVYKKRHKFPKSTLLNKGCPRYPFSALKINYFQRL